MASFTVEIAFASGPFDSPTWVDVSEFARVAETDRGRNYELDRFEAGKLVLTLHDFGTGCFDPSNTSSPFYPGVTIARQIRITASGSGWAEELFTGYIASWVPQWGAAAIWQDVTVEAYDLLRMLGRGNMNSPLYVEFVSGQLPNTGGQINAWYRCDDVSGVVAEDSSGNGYDGQWGGSPDYLSDSALTFDPNPSVGTNNGRLIVNTTAQQTSLSAAGWFRTDDPSYQVIIDRRPPGDPVPTCSLILFGGALVLNVQGTTTTVIASGLDDGEWHMVGVGNLSGNSQVYCDGQAYGPYPIITRRVGDHTTIGAEVGAGGNNLQGQIDEWMIMNSNLNPTDMLGTPNYYTLGQPLRAAATTGVDIGLVLETAAGWTGPTALDAGHITVPGISSTLSAQSALSFIQLLELTEGPKLSGGASNRAVFYVDRAGTPTFKVGDRSTSGANMIGTFGPNTGAGQIPWKPGGSASLDDMSTYGAVDGSRVNGPTYTVSLPTATARDYGLPAPLSLGAMYYSTSTLVRQRIAWELARLSTPAVRQPSLVIQSATRSNSDQEKLAKLELGKFCSVADPLGRWSISVAELERVAHRIDMQTGSWETEVQIAPAVAV